MRHSFYLLIAGIAILFLGSCSREITIAKRQYRPGYYVSISDKNKKTDLPAEQKSSPTPAAKATPIITDAIEQPVIPPASPISRLVKKEKSPARAKQAQTPIATIATAVEQIKNTRIGHDTTMAVSDTSLDKKTLELILVILLVVLGVILIFEYTLIAVIILTVVVLYLLLKLLDS